VVGVRELSAGLALGVAAKAVFAGIEVAAGIVSGQSGFALASMVDPTSGDQLLAPAIFMNLLAIAVFLAADLHHLFILGIHKSYLLLPPAVDLPAVGSLDNIVGGLGLRMFGIAAELAAPALIVTVSIDLVMVLVGKAMPQVPILFVAYPFKMAAAFVALALLTWAIGSGIGLIGRTMASDGAAVLAAFAGNGGV
jgi:flagellar biosynthetic protein FliR